MATPPAEGERCPWKIHFGVSQDMTVQCDRAPHITNREIVAQAGDLFAVTYDYEGYDSHEGRHALGSVITWQPGDRREYTGDWPGPCAKQPCTLHAGHHGRHAP